MQLASSQYDCGCNELECKREGKKILTMKCQETFEFFDSCWEKDQNYKFCEECVESELVVLRVFMEEEEFPYTRYFTTHGVHDDY